MNVKKQLKRAIALMSLLGLFAPVTAHADILNQDVLSQDDLTQQVFLMKRLKEEQAKAQRKAEEEAQAKLAAELANPYVSRSEQAKAAALANSQSGNRYPWGQCTWGVKELAPWAHTYWGNGNDWAMSAAADGFAVGSVPVVGAIAVWSDGGYGHVAYVTGVQHETSIEVLEANIGGNPTIANYRGYFNPTTTSEGVVSYIYPPNV